MMMGPKPHGLAGKGTQFSFPWTVELRFGQNGSGRNSAVEPNRSSTFQTRGSWGRFGLALLAAIHTICAATAQPAEPLTPEQERASFRLADQELVVELVAAEPEVISPVALAWDADGRLFVAEMSDYPNAPTGGRIKLLEDRDGDGRYERATVFADKLPFPNGVLPWKGGVLVTAAPDIWFFKDTDGDRCADERRVMFTGFGLGNQQLRVNGLMWGLDNWVYGANGRSEGDVRAVSAWVGSDWAVIRPALARTNSIRGHDFRFRPGTGEFEAIAGRSQFGQARDDWGNRFLSWNTIPLRHEVLPERYLDRNPRLPATESLQDIFPPEDTRQVFQISPLPKTFNDEPFGYFNASCGPTIYRGTALGEKYYGNAFLCEPLRNLVHRRTLTPSGATFVARRGEEGREFLAAIDPWFHPVNLATGPDGALYVADFYRQWVEHPEFVHNETIEKTVAWRNGADHGRLWRVRPKHGKPKAANPKLNRAQSRDLVKYLAHENGWWRDTAQRLLVERQDRAAIPRLREMAVRSPMSQGRLNALWTLEGLQGLDDKLLAGRLRDADPRVRENAIRLSERFLEGLSTPWESLDSLGHKEHEGSGARARAPAVTKALLALTNDPDPRVRFQLALTLGEMNSDQKLAALAHLTRSAVADPWQSLAILSSVGNRPWLLLKQLMDPRWLDAPGADQAQFLDQLAALVGASGNQTDLAELLTLVTRRTRDPSVSAHLALLAGLADGLAQSNQSLRELMRQPPAFLHDVVRSLDGLIQQAAILAASDQATRRSRLAAVRILARTEPAVAGKVLLSLMLPPNPAEVQSAATKALAEFKDADLATAMFAGWSRYSRKTRSQLLAAGLRTTVFTTPLLDALEQGRIAPVEVDPYTRATLLKIQNTELRQRAEKLLVNTSTPDRQRVIGEFQPSLKLVGDRRHGAVLFANLCLVCHVIQGQGNQVGPDLSGVRSHPKETLMVDILDPSRQVLPDYVNYVLVTEGGETLTGYIETETPTAVTLRRPREPDAVIPRNQIKELRADGKSPMPEGLEQGLGPQDMADLLEFLSQPEAALLPKEQ